MIFSEIRKGTPALLMMLAVASNVQAQNSGPVLVDIAPCMALAANVERYACYDGLAAAARAVPSTVSEVTTLPQPVAPDTTPQAAESPTPAPAQNTSTPVATFGQSTPSETRAAQVVANSGGEEELHDRIASLLEREPGRWVITLESGQIWYQSNSQRNRLRKGMDVRIYPSPLGGSFRMSQVNGSDTGFIQVARIK